ncbi:MAG: hypothetical protein F6K09_00060 [Merismopedia sp. SIO2A8]|nr:hypothetical protein [Merismopedia sp. SIO2A8]
MKRIPSLRSHNATPEEYRLPPHHPRANVTDCSGAIAEDRSLAIATPNCRKVNAHKRF